MREPIYTKFTRRDKRFSVLWTLTIRRVIQSVPGVVTMVTDAVEVSSHRIVHSVLVRAVVAV
jgi:hypothetical protein